MCGHLWTLGKMVCEVAIPTVSLILRIVLKFNVKSLIRTTYPMAATMTAVTTPSADMLLHFLSRIPAAVAAADKPAGQGWRLAFSFSITPPLDPSDLGGRSTSSFFIVPLLS